MPDHCTLEQGLSPPCEKGSNCGTSALMKPGQVLPLTGPLHVDISGVSDHKQANFYKTFWFCPGALEFKLIISGTWADCWNRSHASKTYLSALEACPQAPPWLPLAHGHSWWPQGYQSPPRPRSQAPERLIIAKDAASEASAGFPGRCQGVFASHAWPCLARPCPRG
jgi:hypothetical protein